MFTIAHRDDNWNGIPSHPLSATVQRQFEIQHLEKQLPKYTVFEKLDSFNSLGGIRIEVVFNFLLEV